MSFSNDLSYTEDFNPYTYRNFCNGGGVALGDINNDGLLDIYLGGNMVPNKLYLNKGDLQWEDITDAAGVACASSWTSGVSMVDVNGDDLLDIYVCKAGKPEGERRYNELFINNGDLTFSEAAAEYGLDITGLSIHAAFFDFDRDGDLDCYLLNNSMRSVGGFDLKEGLREVASSDGNKLLLNEDGVYRDVSTERGIYTSAIGYGLGITLSDIDGDSWPDIFISNDFFERDYLYINNRDGSFREVAEQYFPSMSMGSMGADAADINNDLSPDLFVTEMLPKELHRRKTKTQYETWNKYLQDVKSGYHHQYARNVLQVNSGQGDFMEVGRLAGVAATDWSWASLIQDFDNDGLKDIYISNGIYKDLLDKDYLNYNANDSKVRSMIKNETNVIVKLVDQMPSSPVANHMYQNVGKGRFSEVTASWGLDIPTYSNGSAYGDLDNDGDLDLVVNNIDAPTGVFENRTDTSVQRYVQFDLLGMGKNTKAIGAKVVISYGDGRVAMAENFTSRGFQSTVSSIVHFGVDAAQSIDTVTITWPDGSRSQQFNLATNSRYVVKQSSSQKLSTSQDRAVDRNQSVGTVDFKHKEVSINQFAREPMLMKMTAHRGPAIAVGDVNGDGRLDMYVGGGKNQKSRLLLGTSNGDFVVDEKAFIGESRSEVTDAVFYDSDNDGDLDLYVAHGGKMFSQMVPELDDVLYINDGKGGFLKSTSPIAFPYSYVSGEIAVGYLNEDEYLDLVVCEEMKTSLYGLPGSGHILLSNGPASYQVVSPTAMTDLGMITTVVITDTNGDGTNEIVTAGEWAPVTIFSAKGKNYTQLVAKALPSSQGMWQTMVSADLDADGDQDLVLGNQGENSFLEPGMSMYVHDFDGNGTAEQVVTTTIAGSEYTIHDIDEMYGQLPMLRKKYDRYAKCAAATMQEMFGEEELSKALKYDLDEVRSMVMINEGGTFTSVALPVEMQYSSVHAILVDTSGQQMRLVVGGNDYQVKPQYGRLDASSGWQVTLAPRQAGLSFGEVEKLLIPGQIRDIAKLTDKYIFAINNDSLRYQQIDEKQ